VHLISELEAAAPPATVAYRARVRYAELHEQRSPPKQNSPLSNQLPQGDDSTLLDDLPLAADLLADVPDGIQGGPSDRPSHPRRQPPRSGPISVVVSQWGRGPIGDVDAHDHRRPTTIRGFLMHSPPAFVCL